MSETFSYKLDDSNVIPLIRVSAFAIILQLATLAGGGIVIGMLGLQPDSALGYFEVMQHNKLAGLLLDDFFSIVLVGLYLFTFTGLFFIVVRRNFTLAVLSTLLTYVAVILCISAHSGFSMIHLSEQYWATADESMRMQFVAAAEGLIAQNIWNSSSGFFSGLFLQGAGVLVSIAMIKDTSFSKITAFSGIIANGLDLFQHMMHHMRVALPENFLYFVGPFYLIWFVWMARDLFRFGKYVTQKAKTT